MIEFTKAYVVDGKTFATIEAAQQAEIETLLGPQVENKDAAHVASVIVYNSQRVVDILTTSAKSRPRARAVNGGRKPRKKKEEPTLLPLDGPAMAAAAVGIEPLRPS